MFQRQATALIARAEQICAGLDDKTREAMVLLTREIAQVLGGDMHNLEHSGLAVLNDLDFKPGAHVTGLPVPVVLVGDWQGAAMNVKRLRGEGSDLKPIGDAFTAYDPQERYKSARNGMRGEVIWLPDYRGGNYVLTYLQHFADTIRGILPDDLTTSTQYLDGCQVNRAANGEHPGTNLRIWNPPGTDTPYLWAGTTGAAFKAIYERDVDQYVFDLVEQVGS